jgi:hypothetical protein
MESTISGKLLGLLNDSSRFGKNPMDMVADDIIIGWCDLDSKTRYRVAAAVVRLLQAAQRLFNPDSSSASHNAVGHTPFSASLTVWGSHKSRRIRVAVSTMILSVPSLMCSSAQPRRAPPTTRCSPARSTNWRKTLARGANNGCCRSSSGLCPNTGAARPGQAPPHRAGDQAGRPFPPVAAKHIIGRRRPITESASDD